MKRTIIVDGDIVVYKAAIQSEVDTHWGDGFWTLHAEETQGKYLVASEIDDLKEKLNADKVIVTLTDKNNFRKDVLSTYKDNRKEKRKPILLSPLRIILTSCSIGRLFLTLKSIAIIFFAKPNIQITNFFL